VSDPVEKLRTLCLALPGEAYSLVAPKRMAAALDV